MKNTLRVAGAYIGAIIGAGYASGQEILQFFGSYGWIGIIGSIITIAIYPVLGYYIVLLGEKLQAKSHKNIIYALCGKVLGTVIDVLLAFFLFGVGVIMIAGSGSLFSQHFNIPSIYGYIVLTLIVIVTLTLNLDRIITIISWITPYAFILIIGLTVYSLFISNTSIAELDQIASSQLSASPNWILSTFLHPSFNVSIAFAVLAMIGATEKDKKSAKRGAIIGGVALGLIAVIINIGVYANIDKLQGADLPMLQLASDINPVIGILTAIALFGMIFSTSVPCFYTFTARFVTADTKNFKIAAIFVGIAGFTLSFVGFTGLVNTVYPMLGYMGFIMFIAMFVYLLKTKEQKPSMKLKENTQ